MKLLCVGDSLTYGYDVHTNESWVGRITMKTGLYIHNGGVCGDTTDGMLHRLQQFAYASYDAFFLMGGTNDILMEVPLPSVEQNMMAMMDLLVTLHKPVIIGLPLLTRPESALYGWQAASDVKRHNDTIIQYRQWLEKAAISRQYDVVDFYQALLEGEPRLGVSAYADGVHPTAAGYKLLAEAILPVLVKRLPGLMSV